MRLSNHPLITVIATGMLMTLSGLLLAQNNTLTAHPFIINGIFKKGNIIIC